MRKSSFIFYHYSFLSKCTFFQSVLIDLFDRLKIYRILHVNLENFPYMQPQKLSLSISCSRFDNTEHLTLISSKGLLYFGNRTKFMKSKRSHRWFINGLINAHLSTMCISWIIKHNGVMKLSWWTLKINATWIYSSACFADPQFRLLVWNQRVLNWEIWAFEIIPSYHRKTSDMDYAS